MGFSLSISSRRKSQGSYAVVWWPSASDPVPRVKGPYATNEEALHVRNNIRGQQMREEKMAHAVPFDAN